MLVAVAVEQRLDLRLRAPHGRGATRRSLGRIVCSPTVPRGEMVERGLIERRRPCPSGPLMRCNSSWMIRSGGTSLQPLPRRLSPAPWLGGAVEAPLVLAVDMAEEGAGFASQGSRRICRPSRSRRPAAGDRSPRRRSGSAAACRPVKAHAVLAQRISMFRGAISRRNASERLRGERRAAPRAGLHGRWRALVHRRS